MKEKKRRTHFALEIWSDKNDVLEEYLDCSDALALDQLDLNVPDGDLTALHAAEHHTQPRQTLSLRLLIGLVSLQWRMEEALGADHSNLFKEWRCALQSRLYCVRGSLLMCCFHFGPCPCKTDIAVQSNRVRIQNEWKQIVKPITTRGM